MFIIVVYRLKLCNKLSTVSRYYWSLKREFNEERIFKICCLRLESDLAAGWSPTTTTFLFFFYSLYLSSPKSIPSLFFRLTWWGSLCRSREFLNYLFASSKASSPFWGISWKGRPERQRKETLGYKLVRRVLYYSYVEKILGTRLA